MVRTILAVGCHLLLFALVGCSGDAPPAASGPAPGGSEAMMDSYLPQGALPHRVDLEVPSLPRSGTATLVVMGFHASQMEGGWSREKEEPQLYWLHPDLNLVPRQDLSVPLASDLVYVAALDLDGNHDVNSGDIVSMPIDVGALNEEPVSIVLDRPFSPGPEPGGMDLAARPTTRGGAERSITVDTAFGLGLLPRSRMMVVGLATGSTAAARLVERTGITGRIEGSLGPRPAGSYPARVPPTFLWVSLPLKLDWPVRVNALVPDGLDTYVVMDLDGNGYPSTGDVASLCSCPLERPVAGSPPLAFLLESVVPSNEQVADKLMPDLDPEEDEGDGGGEGDSPGEGGPPDLHDDEGEQPTGDIPQDDPADQG